MSEMSVNKDINEMSLNDLRIYCNQIIDENSDLKQQIIQMNKLLNLLNANELLSVFNVIKNNANYGISLLSTYNSIKVRNSDQNSEDETKNESDITLIEDDILEDNFDDNRSLILPDEFLEQKLEEYDSIDNIELNDSNETIESIDLNSVQTEANVSNNSNNTSTERPYKTVTINERVFECLPAEDGVYYCEWDECSRTFTQKGNLMRHYTTHGAEKQFKCPHQSCHREFADNSSLNKHLVVHSGHKLFLCDWNSCKYRTNSRSALRDHRRTHSSDRPFACNWPDCHMRFMSQCHLNDHIRTHTGEKPYPCEWPGCTFRASRNNTLTKHFKTHTGEKPYKCDWKDCTFATTTGYNLKVHKRKHSSEKTKIFKCNLCPQTSPYSSAIDRHKRLQHKIKSTSLSK